MLKTDVCVRICTQVVTEYICVCVCVCVCMSMLKCVCVYACTFLQCRTLLAGGSESDCHSGASLGDVQRSCLVDLNDGHANLHTVLLTRGDCGHLTCNH